MAPSHTLTDNHAMTDFRQRVYNLPVGCKLGRFPYISDQINDSSYSHIHNPELGEGRGGKRATKGGIIGTQRFKIPLVDGACNSTMITGEKKLNNDRSEYHP